MALNFHLLGWGKNIIASNIDLFSKGENIRVSNIHLSCGVRILYFRIFSHFIG